MTLAAILRNPFDHSLFMPAVTRIGILLLVGVILVAAIERKPLGELRRTTLFRRVFSWSVMAPTFLLALFVGGAVGFVIVGYLAIQGLAEYGRLVGLERRYSWLLVVTGLGTLIAAGLLSKYFLFAPLAFFVLVTALPIISGEIDGAHRQVAASLFAYVYIPFFLSYLIFIRVVEPDGLQILLVVAVSVALSDVVAFIVGSILKGPRLAPKVSPGKTWSGALGNLVGAYGGFALMSFATPAEWSAFTRVSAPIALAAAALWGDLVESFVKRDFDVKDAGGLLPGFGGLLDRIDSLLLALPITYYLIIISEYYTTGQG